MSRISFAFVFAVLRFCLCLEWSRRLRTYIAQAELRLLTGQTDGSETETRTGPDNP